MKIHAFPGVCLGLAALSASACAVDAHGRRAEAMFDHTFSVSGPVDLEVLTGSGDILIRTGAAGTVQVHGRVRAGWDLWSRLNTEDRVREVAADPPLEQSGNAIRLGPRGVWGAGGVSISYEVTVPADARVRARTGSGDQIVGGVQGGIDSSAGSGDIRIDGTRGDVRVSTGSGDIEVEASDGSVTARAGSGSIRATDVRGNVSARTGSGRVTVTHAAQGSTEVATGSGDIAVSGARGALRLHAGSGDVTVDGEPAGSWNVGASSGSVTVHVPPTAGFDLVAHSSSGGIQSDHPITSVGSLSRHELRGQVRGGGPNVDINTSSGSIRIR